jgi:hypothetical protein
MDQIEPDQVAHAMDISDLSILGAQGLKLIMDLGDHVDPDFMQALIRECLEEKVNAVLIDSIAQRHQNQLQANINR